MPATPVALLSEGPLQALIPLTSLLVGGASTGPKPLVTDHSDLTLDLYLLVTTRCPQGSRHQRARPYSSPFASSILWRMPTTATRRTHGYLRLGGDVRGAREAPHRPRLHAHCVRPALEQMPQGKLKRPWKRYVNMFEEKLGITLRQATSCVRRRQTRS
ncbi:hypothetical protein GGX14DRAFT_389589 [Mycena pura]|uniref:Uncharacterized protein n=1 Tax=Mycena pura TaxID=153505 RepID=A0AAD6VU61_9AGAR|nr:hypothetical protein GGX14DRAFT_389589 [Mycena pura]